MLQNSFMTYNSVNNIATDIFKSVGLYEPWTIVWGYIEGRSLRSLVLLSSEARASESRSFLPGYIFRVYGQPMIRVLKTSNEIADLLVEIISKEVTDLQPALETPDKRAMLQFPSSGRCLGGALWFCGWCYNFWPVKFLAILWRNRVEMQATSSSPPPEMMSSWSFCFYRPPLSVFRAQRPLMADNWPKFPFHVKRKLEHSFKKEHRVCPTLARTCHHFLSSADSVKLVALTEFFLTENKDVKRWTTPPISPWMGVSTQNAADY